MIHAIIINYIIIVIIISSAISNVTRVIITGTSSVASAFTSTSSCIQQAQPINKYNKNNNHQKSWTYSYHHYQHHPSNTKLVPSSLLLSSSTTVSTGTSDRIQLPIQTKEQQQHTNTLDTTINSPLKEEISLQIGSNKRIQIPIPCLTVLIPAYNEELRIGNTIETYYHFLCNHSLWKTSQNSTITILVVNDGSTDNTETVVQYYKNKYNTNLHNNTTKVTIQYLSTNYKTNRGKGYAIMYGIQQYLNNNNNNNNNNNSNKNHIVVTMDADGSANITSSFNTMYNTLLQSVVSNKVKQYKQLQQLQQLQQQNSTTTTTTIIPELEDYIVTNFWNQPAIVCGKRIRNQYNNNRNEQQQPNILQSQNSLLSFIRQYITRNGFSLLSKLIVPLNFPMMNVNDYDYDDFTNNKSKVTTMTVTTIDDTQCCMKLYTKSCCDIVFNKQNNLNVVTWCHDLEILYRILLYNNRYYSDVQQKQKVDTSTTTGSSDTLIQNYQSKKQQQQQQPILVSQSNVNWDDISIGSKVNEQGIINVSFQMVYDLLRIRLLYTLQIWKVPL